MAEQMGDIAEKLRRISWEIRISRDQLLTAAEGLPSDLLGRAQQTAENLLALHQRIQEIAAKLPDDAEIPVPESLSESVADLHDDNEVALRELDGLLQDLLLLFQSTPVLQTN